MIEVSINEQFKQILYQAGKYQFLLTARQLKQFTLPAQLTGLGIVPLGPGTVPVASWYGACICISHVRQKLIYDCDI